MKKVMTLSLWIITTHAMVENITTLYVKKIAGVDKSRVGLISNATARTRDGARTLDRLLQQGINVTKIFTAEHGFDGTIPAGTQVASTKDARTNIPIVSLYTGNTKYISESELSDIDVLIFDMQDAGMRCYTYISALINSLISTMKCNKPIIVIDRPSLLGGVIEGELTQACYESYISRAPVPLRYGLTIGEIAQYYNKYYLPTPAKLYVVPLQNYHRKPLQKLGVSLSPNLKNINGIFAYSFLGTLGEISPFDVGVGTDHPFEYLGYAQSLKIPKNVWDDIAEYMQQYGITAHYVKYYNPRKNDNFQGLKIRVDDVQQVRIVPIILYVIKRMKQANVQLSFSTMTCKAWGADTLQEWYKGTLSYERIKKQHNDNLTRFYNQTKAILLYDEIALGQLSPSL